MNTTSCVSELRRHRSLAASMRRSFESDAALLARLPRTFTIEKARKILGYKNRQNARIRIDMLICSGMVNIHCRSDFPRRSDGEYVVFIKANP